MPSSRIQAGNSSSTRGVRPALTSNTTATAMPSQPIHCETTSARSVMVAVLAKPSRSDARRGGLDAVPASWTMGAEEDGPAQYGPWCE